MIVFLDTNIVIYLIENPPVFGARARRKSRPFVLPATRSPLAIWSDWNAGYCRFVTRTSPYSVTSTPFSPHPRFRF